MAVPKCREIAFVLLTLLMVISFQSRVFGQIEGTAKLSVIPPRLRPSLISRLNLYIQHDQKYEFGKQFDLLRRSSLKDPELSRESYVKSRREDRRDRLLEIRVNYVEQFLKEKYVEIHATAKLDRGGEAVKKGLLIIAYLQDAEWYFEFWWRMFSKQSPREDGFLIGGAAEYYTYGDRLPLPSLTADSLDEFRNSSHDAHAFKRIAEHWYLHLDSW